MAVINRIPIDQLHPHPDNPRQDVGDVSELADSIKAKGILQNLTVVRGRRGTAEEMAEIRARYAELSDDERAGLNEKIQEQLDNNWLAEGYTVVIGHRRLAAAKLVGLEDLPCVIVEMTHKEQVETMMVENMQRTDLTVYEQAQGFQMMLDLGSPVEEIAEKTGFSDTTVRRRLKWMELDQKKFKKAVDDGQISIGDLDRLSQIENLKSRNECLGKIGTPDFNMAVQKAAKNQAIDANMPAVKTWLKSVKAHKINDSDKWNGKYDRVGSTIYIEKWGEEGNTPPKDIEKKPVFYFIGKPDTYSYGQLDLYHEREKPKPVKRPQEEIDREKAMAEAHAQLEAAAAAAYDLRKAFVEKLTVTKKNEQAILLGAIWAAAHEAINYNSPDRLALYGILGIDEKQFYIPEREALVFENLLKIPEADLAKFVYALFGDDAKQTCCSSYKKEFPAWKRSVKLELIYRWLFSLGYEISTEEDAILTGEHEAFKAGEKHGKV